VTVGIGGFGNASNFLRRIFYAYISLFIVLLNRYWLVSTIFRFVAVVVLIISIEVIGFRFWLIEYFISFLFFTFRPYLLRLNLLQILTLQLHTLKNISPLILPLLPLLGLTRTQPSHNLPFLATFLRTFGSLTPVLLCFHRLKVVLYFPNNSFIKLIDMCSFLVPIFWEWSEHPVELAAEPGSGIRGFECCANGLGFCCFG
jgi:hypothetical protein